LERCGELKGQLVEFATSDRFDVALQERIFDAFPDGVVDDEPTFGLVLDGCRPLPDIRAQNPPEPSLSAPQQPHSPLRHRKMKA
jgi:hypothetical protein